MAVADSRLGAQSPARAGFARVGVEVPPAAKEKVVMVVSAPPVAVFAATVLACLGPQSPSTADIAASKLPPEPRRFSTSNMHATLKLR